MHRSVLLLLTCSLTAGPVLAQTPQSLPPAQIAAQGPLQVRVGNHVTTYPLNPAAAVNTQPTAPVSETLSSFDPQHASVAWSQNHWQVVADGQVLKDFGRREVDARVAMRLVRDLHLTQHGVIGGPQPVMEYWLSNGRAPHGMTTGLHMMPLDGQQLSVAQMQGQWYLREPNRVLFSFGNHENDARTALAIIHKYGFTQIGFLGEAGPSMLVMVGRADADTSDPNMPHLTRPSPLRPAPSNDPRAAKLQQAKFTPTDSASFVAPAIPPLRTPTEPRKESVNVFGHTESVEVLPMKEPAKLRRIPPRPPLATEWIDHTPFDWRHVQLKQEGAQCVLAVGSLVLGRFNNDHDGRLAQAAMQHYRFTEVNRVGRPQPFCSYFLDSGQTPLGQYLGVRCEVFQPDQLSVAQVQNRWAILTPEKPLIWFGARPEEAQVMLEVIQRRQFDRLCHIGDERGLSFFVRSH